MTARRCWMAVPMVANMKTTHNHTITEAALREQYERTALANIGISFEKALDSPVIAPFLKNSVIASRKAAARQAQYAAINYQTREAA